MLLLPSFPSRNEFRKFALGATLAVLISYNAVLTLGYGIFDSTGNSFLTGAFLVVLLLAIFLLSFRQQPFFSAADLIFAGLLMALTASCIINAGTYQADHAKEYLILVTTLAAYVACRPISCDDIVTARSGFERATAIIVVTGAIFTALEILKDWDGLPGKPFVLGFNAAGTYFMGALALLVIALVTVDRPTAKRTAVISALIFIPCAIFAAAMVRHTFLALAGGLLLAAILTEAGKRRHVIAVALTILLAIIAGLSARQSSAKVYTAYLTEEIYGTNVTEKTVRVRPQAKPAGAPVDAVESGIPSCNLDVNRSNSIAIRRVLLMDALYLIPKAGLFGTGLDSFMKYSCIEAHEVHNSLLQTAVEFGWLGGGLFLLLIVFAIYPLVPLARHNGAVRFILCALVFSVLLSFAHGRLSSDGAVFALLGCAIGVRASMRQALTGGQGSSVSGAAGANRSVTA